MNKIIKTVIISISIVIVLGFVFSFVLDYFNSTIPIPLDPEKIENYIKLGCTQKAIDFINNGHDDTLQPDFSDVEMCLDIIRLN
ncbi:hypothetical protein [Nitrosopumilus sp. Nsub]|uniref:hypothetical protein n=1 Tax=Nitrosopumilus sp. Nsub TaxID=1776294 RepID=UPI00082C36A7|nr:hypothetical protein [Nitrosopumilus sp. Nsub]